MRSRSSVTCTRAGCSSLLKVHMLQCNISEALTRVFRLKVEQECPHEKQHWTCVKINPFKYFGISNVTICDKKPALSKFMLIQKKKKTNATTREYPINEVNSSVYAIRYFPDWPYQFCITQFSDRDKSPYCQIPHARRLNFLSILKYVYYSEPNLERPIHCRLFKE